METSNYNENKMGVMPVNKLLISKNDIQKIITTHHFF